MQVVRVLLEAGANPNVVDEKGKTPLRYAAGNKELMQCLLEGGADPNIPDNQGIVPIMVNTYAPEIIALLCENGADIHYQTQKQRYCALHFAAEQGHEQAVKVLLEQGANPKIRDCQGRTPYELTRWYQCDYSPTKRKAL